MLSAALHDNESLYLQFEKLLLQQKEKQEFMQNILKTGYCTEYLEYICVDQTGKLLRPNFVSDHFTYLIKKFGLKKIRFLMINC